jgi:two-component system LytT family response regulator
VDDEKPARQKIRNFLKSDPRITSLLEAENGREAVEMIRKYSPELVFLDIQMPEKNGFDVIREVGVDNMPVAIFVTAYDQYALEAFEVQAVDYLLKPFDQERFRKSFQRALDQIRKGLTGEESLQQILSAVSPEKDYLERIMVKSGPSYFFVKTQEIFYFSSEEKYVMLHTREKCYLIRETLIGLENRLDPARFVKIHRSSIVNLDFIKEIQPWSHGDSLIILIDGTELHLSRRYRDRIFSRP